jgi:hypothetical protein
LITNEHGTGPMTLPILRRDYRLHRSSAWSVYSNITETTP